MAIMHEVTPIVTRVKVSTILSERPSPLSHNVRVDKQGILMTCPYLDPRIPTDAFLFPIKIHSFYIHDFQENGMILHYLTVFYPWIQSQYGVLKLTISGLLPLQMLHT